MNIERLRRGARCVINRLDASTRGIYAALKANDNAPVIDYPPTVYPWSRAPDAMLRRVIRNAAETEAAALWDQPISTIVKRMPISAAPSCVGHNKPLCIVDLDPAEFTAWPPTPPDDFDKIMDEIYAVIGEPRPANQRKAVLGGWAEWARAAAAGEWA